MRWHMRLVALYKCWTFTCCLLHAEVHTRRRHHVTASTYVISSLNCFDEIHGKSQQWNFVLRHAACECIMSVTCWRKVAVHWLTLDCSCCRLHSFFNVNINSALCVTGRQSTVVLTFDGIPLLLQFDVAVSWMHGLSARLLLLAARRSQQPLAVSICEIQGFVLVLVTWFFVWK